MLRDVKDAQQIQGFIGTQAWAALVMVYAQRLDDLHKQMDEMDPDLGDYAILAGRCREIREFLELPQEAEGLIRHAAKGAT